MTLGEAWEAAAEAWSDYVRGGRDRFFATNLAVFLELLPPPCGTTLDIGEVPGVNRPHLPISLHLRAVKP